MQIKNLLAGFLALCFLALIVGTLIYFIAAARLPQIVTLADYKPLVVSEAYARDGTTKIAEFYKEKRIVVPYKEIPAHVVGAFVSAEDNQFFQHGGINFVAIARAAWANLKAGHTVQGGSTITQQVTKSLLLSPEKTMTRKLKEAILAFRIEKNLRKEDILYLYLNQIYLGHGAYGVEAAAQNYFRKSIRDVSVAEAALLAGLPQAPSKYSPVLNPIRAKERQLYVLTRMMEDGKIDRPTMLKAAAEPINVYYRENFGEFAPHFTETVRQLLVEKFGEKAVLEEGIKVYTSIDAKKQKVAQDAVDKYLRELSKRQGFRGPKKNLKTPEEVVQFLTKERDDIVADSKPYRVVYPNEKDYVKLPPLDLTTKPGIAKLPSYMKIGNLVDGVVMKVDSKYGLVTVRASEAVGLIDIDDMSWARKPNPEVHYLTELIKDPAVALKVGDVVEVKIKADKFTSPRLEKQLGLTLAAALKAKKKKPNPPPKDLPDFSEYLAMTLEQEPVTEGALISFDLKTNEVLAMVGGKDFEKSEYNRALQAARQTGSSFKALIYAAALEKGFTPATAILDAPVVFEEGEGQETKVWKPGNFSQKFSGEVLFRNALIKSLNVPTVKILEKIGVDWVTQYARRLGIFHPLNQDLSMALGSSGITLYEMTKAFSVFGRGGKAIHPIIIKKVVDADGKTLIENITLDERFKKELDELAEKFAQPSPAPEGSPAGAVAQNSPQPEATPSNSKFSPQAVFYHPDQEQLIPETSAYIITHLLKGVIHEGTGVRASSLPRPAAGKTGTTNGYFDALFIGFTPYVATGVWVGNDNEGSIGKLETGASAALPIWYEYMMTAIEDTPPNDFEVPPGIVFANIDAETGKLAAARSKKVVREAFKEGTEPDEASGEDSSDETKDFYKEDLSE